MSVCFEKLQELGRNDLNIFLVNELGVPVNAAEIYYQLFYIDVSNGQPGIEVPLAGGKKFEPVNPSIGEYYAAIEIPVTSSIGEHRIRWFFSLKVGGELQEVVQNFCIGQNSTGTGGPGSIFSHCEQDFINNFRILVRDNAPDRHYNFAPPEQESVIGKYNRVFGYLFEDYEILAFLRMSLDMWNTYPPETEEVGSLNLICQLKPTWRTTIIMGAVSLAMMALSINWIRNEFDYSIGGISLSIDRSSKYQGMKDNAEQQFAKMAEAKMMTVKHIRGLRQPRFSPGVRSAFGPTTSKNSLSIKNFV